MKFSFRHLAAPAALFIALAAWAGDTRRFDLDTFERFSAGMAEGVEIKSSGRIAPAPSVEEFKLDEDAVWSAASGKTGEVYVGTGNRGRVYRFSGGSFKQVAQVDRVMVTRVRVDNSGQVWFVAVPEAVLYRMDGNEPVKVADLGETYAWDFAFVGDEIYVATGPKGRILRLSRAGKKLATIETGEEHVMCLLRAGDGKLYAGTSGDGLLLEVKPDGYRIIHDFEEKEVRALGWVEEDKALVAAVNQDGSSRPTPSPSGPSGGPSREQSRPAAPGAGSDDDKEDEQAPAIIIIPSSSAPRGRGRTSGAVYARIGGGVRKLFDLPKRAAVDLAVAGGDVYVGADQEGKVYKCRSTRSDYSIAFDIPPAQALSLIPGKSGLEWIGSGSAAGLYKVKSGPLSGGSYITETLDARFTARWGAIDYNADGGLRVFTRSGAVSDTSRGWSDWTPAGPGRPAAVRSPDARYLQVKVEWLPGSNVTLRSLTVPYRVYNQAAFIDSIQIEAVEQDREKPGGDNRPKQPADGRGPAAHSTTRKLGWKVTNPDNDPLVFEVYFQSEKMNDWIRIPTPAPITAPKFEWQTESLPDGWYRLKIVASDSPANPAGEELRAEAVSELFLVDNGRPEVKGLTVIGRKVAGRAVDSFSGVSGIQYAIDGGDWMPVGADDGVLDSPEESFSFELPEGLAAGPHVLSVRAWDRAGNIGGAQESFKR